MGGRKEGEQINVEQMSDRLQKRVELGLSQDDILELCFQIIKDNTDVIEQSRAAVVLSGIVQPGLGKRTSQFLEENPELPGRVSQVLNTAIIRMEGY